MAAPKVDLEELTQIAEVEAGERPRSTLVAPNPRSTRMVSFVFEGVREGESMEEVLERALASSNWVGLWASQTISLAVATVWPIALRRFGRIHERDADGQIRQLLRQIRVRVPDFSDLTLFTIPRHLDDILRVSASDGPPSSQGVLHQAVLQHVRTGSSGSFDKNTESLFGQVKRCATFLLSQLTAEWRRLTIEVNAQPGEDRFVCAAFLQRADAHKKGYSPFRYGRVSNSINYGAYGIASADHDLEIEAKIQNLHEALSIELAEHPAFGELCDSLSRLEEWGRCVSQELARISMLQYVPGQCLLCGGGRPPSTRER